MCEKLELRERFLYKLCLRNTDTNFDKVAIADNREPHDDKTAFVEVSGMPGVVEGEASLPLWRGWNRRVWVGTG